MNGMASQVSEKQGLKRTRRALNARTLRYVVVFCAIFYAVLPSFTYCRCAGRRYVGVVRRCCAERSLARLSKECCRGRCCERDVIANESQRPAPSRERCCRVFVKSFFLAGETPSPSREVRLDHLGDSLLALGRAHTNAMLAETKLAFYARCKPPRPIYLLLLVLRN